MSGGHSKTKKYFNNLLEQSKLCDGRRIHGNSKPDKSQGFSP